MPDDRMMAMTGIHPFHTGMTTLMTFRLATEPNRLPHTVYSAVMLMRLERVSASMLASTSRQHIRCRAAKMMVNPGDTWQNVGSRVP